MLKKDTFYPYFNDILKKYFVENYEDIKKKLKKYCKLDGKIMKTPIWNKKITANYTDLLKEYEIQYNKCV